MSETCVFCEIVAGESPASFVYEDDLTVAFIDLRQFHPGHTYVFADFTAAERHGRTPNVA
ncbi:MAG: HIT family protein [Longimicrobiales bacterium]